MGRVSSLDTLFTIRLFLTACILDNIVILNVFPAQMFYSISTGDFRKSQPSLRHWDILINILLNTLYRGWNRPRQRQDQVKWPIELKGWTCLMVLLSYFPEESHYGRIQWKALSWALEFVNLFLALSCENYIMFRMFRVSKCRILANHAIIITWTILCLWNNLYLDWGVLNNK